MAGLFEVRILSLLPTGGPQLLVPELEVFFIIVYFLDQH